MRVDAASGNSVYRTPQNEQPDKVSRTQPAQDAEKPDGRSADQVPRDEYISREKSMEKPTGLYRLVSDENGNPKLLYDDPKKQAAGPAKADKAENCTTDTDKVDREIEQLKNEKAQLEQQIKAAAGDKKKTGELERKLSDVERELSRKDNDAYRRENAEVKEPFS